MGKLNIQIKTDGTFSIDAQGFTGTSCKDATKALQDKFAGASMDVKDKPELAMLDTSSGQEMGMVL